MVVVVVVVVVVVLAIVDVLGAELVVEVRLVRTGTLTVVVLTSGLRVVV